MTNVTGVSKEATENYVIWHKDGPEGRQVHRDDNKPAVIHLRKGKERKPSVEFRAWYENGVLLREVYRTKHPRSGVVEVLSDLYYYDYDNVTEHTNPILGKDKPVTETWLDKWLSDF